MMEEFSPNQNARRCGRTLAGREMFVPLAHLPGHAQVDFGECIGVIGGVRMKLHVFCFDLPQSDACFIKACPAETTEAFLEGRGPSRRKGVTANSTMRLD
jgi:hypothetical protein